MAKIKYPQIRTGKGIAVFPSIHKEATYKENGKLVQTGKFECKIILNDAKAEKELKAAIHKLWDEVCADPAKFNIKASVMAKVDEDEPNVPYYEDKDGNTVFKTNCNVSWKNREGKEVPIKVPVFDAKAKPTNVEVTGGSTIKLQVSLVPYAMNKAVYGVKLRLEAVQLLELKQWERNPFEAEEGYEGMEDDEEANTSGFDAEEEGFEGGDEDSGDGDF